MASGIFLGCLLAVTVQSDLSGVRRTEHLEIHFRPGSRAAASVDRTAVLAEREVVRMAQQLGVKMDGRFGLYVYDDLAELALATGVQGTGGFSAGRDSHVPYDNDQTRFHELVHVVAAACIPQTGPEARSLFFAEGLSNALLEFVHGVPVHAVAKTYRAWGKLPPIRELTAGDDFYDWLRKHPGFNGYDVGGSWLRFLLDAYGPAKLKRYYGGVSPRDAFGKSEPDLERAWHAMLDAFQIQPELELLLRERDGQKVEFAKSGLPSEILGEEREWRSLVAADLHPEHPGDWKREKEGIVGKASPNVWSLCDLGAETYGDCAVRARIRTDGPTPIQVRLGEKHQAMLVNGTFLYRDGAPFASSDAASIYPSRDKADFLLLRRGGSVEIWIDERKALSAPADPAPARIGIGVHGGRAVFEDVRVRPLGETPPSRAK